METLSEIIKNLVKRGARPLTVTMKTTPRLRGGKKVKAQFDNPYKISVVNGMLNFDYEKSVNRQLGREAKAQDFKVRPNWFVHTETPGIVCHRKDANRLYIQLKVERAIESNFFTEAGEFIAKETIEPFLYENSKPTHQGVEKFVHVIEVSFENIKTIVCENGKLVWSEKKQSWESFFNRAGITVNKAPLATCGG